MEKDWQDQLKVWAAEGKDVDAIYSPRPKPASAKATKKLPATSTPEVEPTNDDVIVPVVSCNRNII
eukprot:6398232-Amphidinium_carterae.1